MNSTITRRTNRERTPNNENSPIMIVESSSLSVEKNESEANTIRRDTTKQQNPQRSSINVVRNFELII